MTKIAIIEADTPVPAVVEKLGTYGSIFKNLLLGAGLDENTTEFSIHHVVEHPENLPDLANSPPDAVLISGSKHNSYDDIEWINKLAEFAADAVARGIKIIGICFGHQIIARGLGTKLGVNPKGWEISSTRITLTEKGREVFSDLADQFGGDINIMQMHRDIVFEAPENTEVLAYNDVCAVQGFYRENAIWTVQGHPEFTDFIEKSIIELRTQTGAFSPELGADGLRRATDRNDGPLIAKSIVKFILQ